MRTTSLPSFARLFGALSLSLVLATSGLPSSLAQATPAQTSSTTTQPASQTADLFTADDVPALLAAGDYAEGRVLACVTEDHGTSAVNARSAASSDESELYEFDDETAAAREAESAEAHDQTAASTSVDGETTAMDADAILAQASSIVLIEDAAKTTEELLYELADNDSVLWAEPDYVTAPSSESAVETTGMETLGETSGNATSARTASPAQSQEDPLLSRQWQLDSTADSAGGTNVQEAWAELGYTSSASVPENEEVVVAVLDTGVDYTNPDLANIMWEDAAVSAVLGWGAHGYDYGSWDDDPMDTFGHGTHVAGIVAAELGNGEGGAGMAPNARIMALKCSDDSNAFFESSTVSALMAVKTASELGVNIVATNNSYYGSTFSQLYALAMQDLYESCGIVSFVCSGNDALDRDQNVVAPGNMRSEGILNVNAHDSAGQMAVFTDYGAVLTDLSAPGDNVLSTVPMGQGMPDLADESSVLAQDTYNTDGGTTFSFEVVTGDGYSDATIERKPGEDGTCLSFRAENPVEGETFAIVSKPVDLTEILAAQGSSIDDVSALALESIVTDGSASGYARTISFEVAAKDGGWIDISGSNGFANATWTTFAYDLASVRDQVDWANFQIRIARTFVAFDATGWLELGLDTVTLLANDYRISPYGKESGTSMAAPAAAGAYALLCALYPDDTPAQRVNRLLGATERTDALAGTSVSEGALNLDPDALADPAPIARTAEQTGADLMTLTISGGFFGNAQGTVSLEGIGELTVLAWADDHIEATLPTGISQVHQSYLTVTRADGESARLLVTLDLTQEAAVGAAFETLPAPDWEALGVQFSEESKSSSWIMEEIDGVLYVTNEQLTVLRDGEKAVCVLAYEVATQQWSVVERIADLRQPEAETPSYLSMCSYGGLLYLATAELDALWTYDPATDELTCLSDSIVPANGAQVSAGTCIPAPTMACDGNYCWFSGVFFVDEEAGGTVPSPALWYLDLSEQTEGETLTLREGPSLDEARSNTRLELLRNRLIAVGGGSAPTNVYGVSLIDPTVHWISADGSELAQGTLASLSAVAESQDGAVGATVVPAGTTLMLADGSQRTTIGESLLVTGALAADGSADTYLLDLGEGDDTAWRALSARLSTVKAANVGAVLAGNALYAIYFDQTTTDANESVVFKRLALAENVGEPGTDTPPSADEPANEPSDPNGQAN